MPPPVTCRPSRACAPTTWSQDHGHQPAQRPAGGPLARRKAIFARLDSDIALEVLERDPTPQAAQRLGEARLAAFLGRHGYSGRRTPAQLLHRLPAARSPSTSSIPRSRVDCIRIQVRLLRSLLGSLAELDRALAAALGEHPKATVLQPLPRIGQINLAQVLAEVGPILDRASDLSHAAAEVGATPVTKQSGKGAVVQSAGQPIPVPAMPWASSPTQPPRLSVGSPPVPASPPARQAPPPGDPHPDARLATSDLGPLAYRPALRHHPPPRRTTAGPRTRSLGLTQGTRDRCLWHASARPARATTLVRGGDGSQLAQWVRPDLR
jgi:hypothetical protein